MHVLISEDLVDHDYIAQYTIGYAELKQRAWNGARARGEVCGITTTEVVELARLYGQACRSGGVPPSAPTTACSACMAVAWPCAISPVCRP